MPEDALAAEKPSFNRGPDGRTPFGVPLYRSRITALADEAMQCSGRGQYMLAQSTHDQIAGVVEDEKAHRVEEEKVRQREERLKLDRAYRIEKERFEAEWAERARLVEGESEEKLKVLREVLAIARDDVERELAAKAKAVALQFKASSKLLTLEDTERRLVGAREYAQAEEVARRARRLRKQEEARYERNKGGFIVKRREAMAKLQEAEMANLEQKCHGAKVQVRREREEALVVLKQRCARLDLSPHAPPAASLTRLPPLRSQVPQPRDGPRARARDRVLAARRDWAGAVVQEPLEPGVDLPRHAQARVVGGHEVRRARRVEDGADWQLERDVGAAPCKGRRRGQRERR